MREIYDFPNYKIDTYGNVWNKKGLMLSPRLNRDGYLRINLYNHRGRPTVFIHTLVASTYIRPLKEGEVVNHKNGIKTDNRPANLEITTQRVNMLHSINVLGNSVLNYEKACEIRELLKNGTKSKEIEKIYGISQSTVSEIKMNNRWKKEIHEK